MVEGREGGGGVATAQPPGLEELRPLEAKALKIARRKEFLDLPDFFASDLPSAASDKIPGDRVLASPCKRWNVTSERKNLNG